MSEMAKFEVFRSSVNFQYYFHFLHGNGETLLMSEAYLHQSGALSGISAVKTHAAYDYHYQRLEATNNTFYFNLRTKNFRMLGTSSFFKTKVLRDNAMDYMKAYVSVAEIIQPLYAA